MSTDRDAFEKCPRCAVELTDARSARGCRSCGALWVEDVPVERAIVEPTRSPTSPETAPSWDTDDPRMNDRQGLGLGPGDGPNDGT